MLIEHEEAGQIWQWIREVGANDAVMADYEVAAPLSSRRQLYSYIMDVNLPKNYPDLDSDFRWLFIRNGYPFLNRLLEQGFEVVYQGKYLTVARRRGDSLREIPIFSDFARTQTLDKMSIHRTTGQGAPSDQAFLVSWGCA